MVQTGWGMNTKEACERGFHCFNAPMAKAEKCLYCGKSYSASPFVPTMPYPFRTIYRCETCGDLVTLIQPVGLGAPCSE